MRFERLVIEREVESRRQRDGKLHRRWECRCDCGRTVRVTTGQLSTGHTKSCGCLKREGSVRNRTYLEIGTRFGRLVVEGRAVSVGTGRVRRGRWRCRCDCGEVRIVTTANLTSGNTKSCGCWALEKKATNTRTHGHTSNGKETSTFSIWMSMLDRCLNSNGRAYRHYGERGIGVDRRWLKFENFLLDMGERPPGLSLERRDNDKGYSKENCYWATRREQARNKRSTRYVTYNGETVPLIDLAERYGVKSSLVRVRLDVLGWSLEEALMPKGRDRRVTHYVTYGGESVPLPELARRHGLDPALLRQRLVRNGMSLEEALALGPGKEVSKASGIRTLWKSMLARCRNPKNPAYPNYGGRGIGVDPRWLDFETFLADMGPRPEGYTLERLDNEKGYGPDNCKWATLHDQQRNTRRTRRVMFEGELVPLIELAERHGQPPKLVQVRLDVLGWSLEEALTLKKGKRSI
jgi:hypothetical protein